MKYPSCQRFLLVVATALVALHAVASAQTAEEWVTRANEQYRTQHFAESADSYGKAIEAGAKNPTTFYNAACSSALAEQVDAAFARLDDALTRGFRDVALLVDDTDLDALHDDPRWTDVVARCKQARVDYLVTLQEPELWSELQEMRRIDQAVRRGEALPELAGRGMGDVDAENTARMKEIVEEHGWPTVSLVGEDGASTAWLLVQHADADPVFQRKCLDLMMALPEGEVDRVDVAYLIDRVRVNEGKKQFYGTQFWTVDGELVPRPIEDEAGLEARRAEIGMISMKEYTARMTGRR